MKPWREIAIPHEDVLKGTFQQSEFAADLSKVHDGTASEEYQNPTLFFERTFITEGMRLLLDSVIRRLSGQGGDPVVQLQTAFGGGKTHTLLAVYHMAKGNEAATDLPGITPILDTVGISQLPKAKIVVLDGTRFSPSEPKKHDSIVARTLWGEMAWQLGGEEGYAQVAASDTNGTAPDATLLEQLLIPQQPVVMLMDELVAYLRNFEDGKSYTGGTFDSNLTFIQNLTQAFKAVPSGMLLVSLPASKQSEAGGLRGHRAIEGIVGAISLRSLENTVGRVHALWKPIGTEEAFEIVRRRLFTKIMNTQEADEVCREFVDLYTEHRADLPKEIQEGRYLDRMTRAYPIHPEVFDRLYEDWSSLDNFQRTRGVLKLMAKAIHRLWTDGNNDALIMPGSLPLYDPDTRNEVIYYLPQGWDPVVERDIDGDRAETTEVESQDPRFGSVQACRRLARTVFLGSAPTTADQTVRGIELERVYLGVLQPNQQIAVYKDALRRLVDRLHYLNSANNRYWFDVRPNLRREMEGRKRRFNTKEHIVPEIKTRVQTAMTATVFAGIHVFTASSDVPDDWRMHLVVLPPDKPFSRVAPAFATAAANEILNNRGDQPRIKRNRVLFIAADTDGVPRLEDQVCSLLAWDSIVKSIDEGDLNLDQLQSRQARKSRDTASETVNRTIRETYKWLLSPAEEIDGKGISPMHWEHFALNTGAPSLTKEIEHVMTEHELLITQWAPVHLDTLLRSWFWRDSITEVGAQDVWQKTCQYLYMPRLRDSNVFASTLMEGARSRDFFGLSQGKREDKYLAFSFGQTVIIHLESNLLIEPQAAAAYEAKVKAAEEAAKPKIESDATSSTGATSTAGTAGVSPQPAGKPNMKRFFGTIELNPLLAKKQFAQVVDEVLELFTTRPNASVKVIVELQAESVAGFDEGVQRSVKENCNALKFNSSGFESGDH